MSTSNSRLVEDFARAEIKETQMAEKQKSKRALKSFSIRTPADSWQTSLSIRYLCLQHLKSTNRQPLSDYERAMPRATQALISTNSRIESHRIHILTCEWRE